MRQEELATHLGISQGQLSKVESGKLSPTLEIVFGVAMKFRKSLDWLVTGHGS